MRISKRQTLRLAGTVMVLGYIAGCTGGDGDEGSPTPASLEIAEVVFVVGQPDGYDDYEVQPEATYQVGDVIWIYIDVLNIGTEEAGDGEVAVDLTEELVIRDDADEVVFEDEIPLDRNFPEGIDMQTFFLVNDVVLPMAAGPGEYVADITIHDEVANDSTSTEASFALVE